MTDDVDLPTLLSKHGLELTPDGEFVRWSCSNPNHPRNWTTLRKVTAISTAGSSAADSAYQEFGISRLLAIFFFVSLYLIAQGIGGTIFPSCSESFGRKRLYIISTGLFSIFCVVVGVVPHPAGAAVGRFFSGLCSAIPTVVSAGSIEDMFNSKDRVWMIFTWTLMANIGLVIGPIMSAYIIDSLSWQWLFYIAAIVTAIASFLCLEIRESRPSQLLAYEITKIQRIAPPSIPPLRAQNPDHTPNLRTFMQVTLFRPIRLFCTEPIVFMVSSMSAVAFALIYLLTEVMPPIYEAIGLSTTSASLPFLAIGIGLVCGLLTRITDHRTLIKSRKANIDPQPEHKLLGFTIGAPLLAIGLWWFAWTIPPTVSNIPWIVPTLALVLVGYALNEFDAVLAGYLADSYLTYAASGFAALALVRAMLSAIFPLFATQMFNGLGSNVAVSVLAAVATVFCAVPPLFVRFGAGIRARSRFARHSLQVYRETGVDKDGF
ncbi:MFS multidrug transporter [Aspergillus venezuelensis]